jgi:hypothetical protein
MPIPRSLLSRGAGKLWLTIAALLLVIVSAVTFSSRVTLTTTTASINKLPRVILWAWERPERLDFIDSKIVGVAFLSRTLYLRGNQVVVRPRLQPLKTPDSTTLIAVARIESDREDRPELNQQQTDEVSSAVAELAKLPGVIAVQVDFDATVSERRFYRQLLLELRRKLPQSTSLSITALASWCKGDNWLDELPIDEAIPMLFRMGVEEKQFRSQLLSGGKFSSMKCQDSLGLSTDEPLPGVSPSKRNYYFNPRSWTAASVSELLKNHETH